jgi:hypothetical protein
MVILSGLREGAEVAHAVCSPELSRAFETALTLSASRLDGSGADGPATTVDGSIIESAGMRREIVLFAHHHLSSLSFRNFQSGYLGQHLFLAPMPQFMAKGFGPPRGGAFIIPVEGASQAPQVFAGMVEVEQLGRSLPVILRHLPYPGGAICDHQPSPGRVPALRAAPPSATAS